MALFSPNSAFSRVTVLAAQRPVHLAFAWLRGNPKTIMDWQAELVAIPAPPFGEQPRAGWLSARFAEAGLSAVEADAIGNVFGWLPATRLPVESTGPVVVLSAHLDTVFPAGTPLKPAVDGDRLEAPGACDNGAGLVGMLAIAHALVKAKVELPVPLVFLGNVGEEGEGDLRGMRHLYQSALAGRIAAHIVLDGAGADSAVTQALGSRRYRVTVTGPGGHSFTDAGTPNPIAALASALAVLAEAQVPDELLRLEVALHRAVEDAIDRANAQAKSRATHGRGLLNFAIDLIGDRPAAQLPSGSPLLEALSAVDRHLGLRTDMRLGSTDANIPLSLGIPALSIGAGGDGGGAHTLAEWYSARDRETGLKRVLLLTLAMAVWAAVQ
jgi:acetylornithine deacetylase/succinyl-diaminopimelate desuccinylase-like protein